MSEHPNQTVSLSPSESVNEAVVQTIATLENVDPTEIEPLYDSIDPDALEALIERGSRHQSETAVEFDYSGYRVRVSTTGELHVFTPR